MKKLIGTVVLAAMVAGAAFAEISMGVWLRAMYSPVAGDGEDILYGTSNSWGWGARTARVDIVANSDDGKAGMQLSVYRDMWDDIDGNGEAKLWVKPIDQIKLTLGKIDAGAGKLAGGLCYGSWDWLRSFVWLFDGGEQTMSGLGGGGAAIDHTYGLLVEIEPIESLYIMALLFDGEKEWTEAYKQFDKFQAGVKYTIENVGAIKAQWISNIVRDGGDLANTGVVEAAFDLTGIENLFITLGFGFHIYDADKVGVVNSVWTWYNFNNPDKIKLALGASYQIVDAVKIYANFDLLTFDDIKPAIAFGIGADINIVDSLSLNIDFRGAMSMEKDMFDYDPVFGFLVGLKYACSSNGYIGIGFQGTTNGKGLLDRASIQGATGGSASSGCGGVAPAKDDAFCWAVPIAMSVWF